jgi:recombination protein RecA
MAPKTPEATPETQPETTPESPAKAEPSVEAKPTTAEPKTGVKPVTKLVVKPTPPVKKVPLVKGKVVTKISTAAADAARSKQAAAARHAIFKATGHRTIGEKKSPWPSVSTGSFIMDHMIGGTPSADGTGPKCPGYPRRHITELFGAESSGKTTAALEAVAEAQRQGGIAMFLDFEHSLDSQYAKRIGVKFQDDYFLNYQPDTMEEGWKHLYFGLRSGVDIIVVDSIAAMVPAEELKKKIDDPARIGAVARALAQILPKMGTWLHSPVHSINPLGTAIIFINQTRALISSGSKGDNENTAGGKALKFYAALRLKFTRTGSASVKKKDPFTGKERTFQYGNYTIVKLVKSKVDGKQGLTSNIFIRYNHGIDDYYSLIEAAATTGQLKKGGGGNYEFNGQTFRGMDKIRAYLMDNEVLFEALRAKVLNAVRDDVEIAEEELSDEDAMLQSAKEVFGEEDDGDTTPEDITLDGSDLADGSDDESEDDDE